MTSALQSSTVGPSANPIDPRTVSPTKSHSQEVGPSQESKSPVKGQLTSPQGRRTAAKIQSATANAQLQNMGTASKLAIAETLLKSKDEEIEKLEGRILEKENEIKDLKNKTNQPNTNAATPNAESAEELQTKIAILTVAVKELRSEILKIYFREGLEKLSASDNYLKYTGIKNFPGRRHLFFIGTSVFAGLCATTQAEGIAKKIGVFVTVAGMGSAVGLYLTDPDSKVIQTMNDAKKKCKEYNLKWQPSQNFPSEGEAFFNLVRESYSSSWYSAYTFSNNKEILQFLADEVPETTLDVSTDTAAVLPDNTAASPTAAAAPKTASIPAQRPNPGTPTAVSNLPARTRRELFPPALPTDQLPLPSVITQSTSGAAK